MNNRIAALLNHLSLSSSAFAESIGVQRSSISHVLSGRNKPSLEFIQKIISAYPEISVDWLVTGNGNIEKDVKISRKEQQESISTIEEGSSNDKREVEKSVPAKSYKKGGESIQKSPKSVNHIEKLILVYSDQTFEEIYPKD